MGEAAGSGAISTASTRPAAAKIGERERGGGGVRCEGIGTEGSYILTLKFPSLALKAISSVLLVLLSYGAAHLFPESELMHEPWVGPVRRSGGSQG